MMLATVAACDSPYYEIEINNVGNRNIAIESLKWGDRETAAYPGGIRLSAIPTGHINRGLYGWQVDWRIPELVTVVWRPEGLDPIHHEFELRKHVSRAESYKDTIVLEFEDSDLRVYTSPTNSRDPNARKLIVAVD